MELNMSPSVAAKLSSTDADQLPPSLRLSMAIEGLPPLQQSKHVHDAEKLVMQYVERWQITSFDAYCRLGLSTSIYYYPGVVGVDRLVAVSILMACTWVLDDLFFDCPDEFLLDQYGIDRSTRDSPHRMLEYHAHLYAVFGQQKPPHKNPATGMEAIMWEMGRDMLQLSNVEWLGAFVEGLMDYSQISVASQADIAAGHKLCVQDLESYTLMRAGNSGGWFCQLVTEFAHNTYFPSNALRSHPYMQKVTLAVSIHVGFVNDIFSYHKESLGEAHGSNPRNLITVLMESEGKSFVQAVHAAIALVNTYTRTILDLESEAWNSVLQHHLHFVKTYIAGNIYFHYMDKRYRHPDSFFPELRDTSTSWKLEALPHSESPGL